MSQELTPEPQQERMIGFYGDNIPAAQIDGDEIFVPLRPMAEFLGLSYSTQLQRVKRDEEMAELCRTIRMRVQASGQRQEVFCLPLKLIPTWLFGISTNRVNPALRDKLRRYRREVFDVLWNAFKGDVMPAAQQVQTLTPAEQILAQAEAIAAIARQQVELERQYRTMADYTKTFIVNTRQQLTTHDAALTNHEQRLVNIELRLDPAAQITDEEAAEIALAVKNVAYAMSGGSPSYGKVYSEMYRRYRISSYKNLPRAKYDEVTQWLSRWYDELTANQNAPSDGENQ